MQKTAVVKIYSAARLSQKLITMEAGDATTDTIMTDEVMTEQQPAAAAMETTEDDAPPARLMITKMVRLSQTLLIAAHQLFMTRLF